MVACVWRWRSVTLCSERQHNHHRTSHLLPLSSRGVWDNNTANTITIYNQQVLYCFFAVSLSASVGKKVAKRGLVVWQRCCLGDVLCVFVYFGWWCSDTFIKIQIFYLSRTNPAVSNVVLVMLVDGKHKMYIVYKKAKFYSYSVPSNSSHCWLVIEAQYKKII